MYYILALIVSLKTIYFSLFALLRIKTASKASFFDLAKKWSSSILRTMRIRVNVTGTNYLKNTSSCIVIANHSSMLDIPALLSSLPYPAGIIYKSELEKVPLFGYTLKKSPFPSVSRDDAQSSFGSLKAAAKLLKEGFSLIIFPEGTRSETNEIREFHKGAFSLSKWLDIPIAAVYIEGSAKLLPKGSKRFRAGEINLRYSELIYPNERDSEEILVEVKERLINLSKNEK